MRQEARVESDTDRFTSVDGDNMDPKFLTLLILIMQPC